MTQATRFTFLLFTTLALILSGCGDDDSGGSDTGSDTTESDTSTDVATDGTTDSSCACEDGETETRPSLNCGEETRTCSSCVWSDWMETTPGEEEPECLLGEALLPESEDDARRGCDGRVRWRRCGADCRWETELSECGGGCDGVRRNEPADSEEICVPGGATMIGCEDESRDCFPRHEVYLSPFYIDRYQVTYRRYQECVVAGACTELTDWRVLCEPGDCTSASDSGFDEDRQDGVTVWGATEEQAEAFCAWDGASLATGAQWERAATGTFTQTLLPWVESTEPDSLGRRWCGGGWIPCTARVFERAPRTFDESRAEENSIGLQNHFFYFEWVSDGVDPYDVGLNQDPFYLGRRGMRGGAGDFVISAGGAERVFLRDIAARFNAGVWFTNSDERGAIRCARPPTGER